jgi:hypothetical protein
MVQEWSRMVKILQGKAILPHCRQSYGLQKGPDELPPTRSNKPTPQAISFPSTVSLRASTTVIILLVSLWGN